MDDAQNKKIPFEQWKADKQNKIDAAFKQLEQGVKDVFTSERYSDYLSTMAKFHPYSPNNAIMIFQQKPDASLVAGYNKWQSDFGRQVIKGEKALYIFAPSQKTVNAEKNVVDPTTKQPVMDPDTGKPQTKTVKEKQTRFKLVPVFDISQTEGKPLPTLTTDLTGDVQEFPAVMDGIKTLADRKGFSFEYGYIARGVKGQCFPDDRRIVIQEGMSEAQTMKTGIHELAHARLHSDATIDRQAAEVQAESTAFAVCKHFGLDTSDYSFPYVAGWSGDKNVTELKESLSVIQKESSAIITHIEKQIAQSRARAASLPPDMVSIYQLKQDENTSELRYRSLDQIRSLGLSVDHANYENVYTAPLTQNDPLESLYEKFNAGHPPDLFGQSLSVSDVVICRQGGMEHAYYVDQNEFKTVREFLEKPPGTGQTQRMPVPARTPTRGR